MDKKSIPEISPQSQWLAARLARLGVGETVAYSELNAIAGCDVRHAGRGFMHTARRVALRDHRIATAAVASIGIKRLDDQGVADQQARALELVARALRRQEQQSQVADPDKLAPAMRTRFMVNRSQGLGMRVIASSKTHGALVQIATKSQSSDVLSMDQLMRALKGPNGTKDE